jgi:glycosyltransferase involved in cell wall biosynthesis
MGLSTGSGAPLITVTYLSMDPLTSTVGSSQVLAYIERLALAGVDIDLVTFEHAVDVALSERLSSLGVGWRPQRYGRHGSVGGLGRVLRAAWAVRKVGLAHARSDMAAAAVMLGGVERWVWDVRSFWADQKVATGVMKAGSLQERVMQWVERRAAYRSDAVITLTASAIVELDRRYDCVVSPKAQVITTCVDVDRFWLSDLPSGSLRVLLAGTLNRYYDVELMLDLVAELRRREPVEFIVASPTDTDWEREFLRAKAVRLSTTPSDMAALVSSCHIGLSICRDDAGLSLLAAMPTKIGEFLASGRPVVVNAGLVDATEMLESNGCGVAVGMSSCTNVVEVADRLEELRVDLSTTARCRSLAERYFNLDQGVGSLVEVYSALTVSR